MTIGRFAPLCLGLMLAAGAAPLRAQVCVPHAAADPALDGDGTGAGDWDAINSATFQLGSAGGAADPNYRVRMVSTATHLYFFSEVTAPLVNPNTFRLTVGIGAGLGPMTTGKMVRVSPFLAGDVAPLSNNTIASISTLPGGFVWTNWAPAPTAADFWRVLQNAPTEQWKLEGRISLADIGIASRDNFNLFLLAQTGATSKFWPIPPGAAPDVTNQANVTFGAVRCPSLQVTSQPLDFGKLPLNSSPTQVLTITNNGPAGSVLNVTAVTSPSAPFTFTSPLTKMGGGGVPFNLGAGETANATVQFTPVVETTIGNPAASSITLTTSDPDAADASRVVPMQGHARRNIDMVFILDQSGSMLDQNKWLTTEWAVEVTAEVGRIFRLPGDRMGAVGFGGTYSAPSRYSLRALTNTPAGGQPPFVNFADANPLFWTPIGYGLIAGDSMFNQNTPRLMGILMSDGIHNRPQGTEGAVTVEGLNLPPAVTSNAKGMEIHTVALGTDAGVSTPLLNDIRDHYKRPGTNPPLYNITSNPTGLVDAFLQAIMNAYIVNQIPLTNPGSGGVGYEVDAGQRKYLAMVVWDRGDVPADIEVRVFSADGGTLQSTYTSGSMGITYFKGPNPQQPFTYVLVTTPAPADQVWRITGPGGAALGGNAHPVVLVDLNLEGVFDVRQQVNGTGNDIILTARLTDFGQRITNTPEHPVSVRASIERPLEGLGTFVSTITLPACGKGGPILPDWRPRRDQPGITAGAMMGSGAAGFAPADTMVDVTLPRFARADSLFKACGRDSLAREETAELELFDDGTHGDVTANDGEYTLRFTNTEYEGSYLVRYLARGTTASGRHFSRRRVLGTHLRVDVDPASSVFDWRDVGSDQGTILTEYFVIPRDRNGEYLGPGYTSEVEFATAGGTWWGPIVDYNNGIYGRVLRWTRETGRPKVTATVQGEDIPHSPFAGLTGGTGGDGFGAGGGRSEWEIFGSYTMLDDALNVDDALGLGIRFAAPLGGPLRFELEGATTFPELGDDSVRVSQLFAGLRLEAALAPALLASVSAGGGVMHFSGGGASETAGAGHASGALTLLLNPHFGIRGTGRLLYVSDVRGAGGSTTGTQATVGLVFRP
jgi:hypothetical protein